MNVAVAKTPAEVAFGGIVLPHPRMEEWRWTNLRVLIDRPYPPRLKVAADPRDVARLISASAMAKLASARLVFVNGEFASEHSKLPASGDVSVDTRIPEAPRSDEPLLALNSSFATAGLTLTIAAGANIDTPIELLFIATAGEPRTIATRVAIEIGAGASATIVETHLGEGAHLSSSALAVSVGEGARLDRVKLALEGEEGTHLADYQVAMGRAAILRDFSLASRLRLMRQNGTYRFDGEGADARISGSYLLGGRQHADTRLVVDHAAPGCTSRELFKCVMDDHARGIFQGKVIVERGAQKTDGKQSSHALLLSETAEFDAKPELEIYADDVICGHGATSGDIDENHLFYLRSRGIPEPQAKSMLIAAFVEEAFETVAHEGIRQALSAYAANWLGSHG